MSARKVYGKPTMSKSKKSFENQVNYIIAYKKYNNTSGMYSQAALKEAKRQRKIAQNDLKNRITEKQRKSREEVNRIMREMAERERKVRQNATRQRETPSQYYNTESPIRQKNELNRFINLINRLSLKINTVKNSNYRPSYKNILLTYHPNKGGDPNRFTNMQQKYQAFLQKLT